MLHIHIIAVGRLKEKFWNQACDEYLKRLRPYASVSIKEISDIDPSKVGGDVKAIEGESKSVLASVPDDAIAILMDIKGKSVSSEMIADKLEEFSIEGKNDICFIIGGSCGVDDSVRNRADMRWSMGQITLPHNLARVVLLEQIYRAFKIIKHEPYHK